MGEKLIKIQFELLRAKYDFEASRPKTLSFLKNDYFLLHATAAAEKNWWQVINAYGQVGYVPSNYVTTVKVSPSFYQQFLDTCIEYLNQTDDESSVVTQYFAKDELIKRLLEKKRQAELTMQDDYPGGSIDLTYKPTDKIHDPRNFANPMRGQGECIYNAAEKIGYANKNANRNDDLRPVKSEIKPDKLENMHRTTSSPDLSRAQSQGTNKKMSEDPVSALQPLAIYRLVDSVRQSTDLSFKLAKVAVSTVVSELQDLLPGALTPHLASVLWHADGPLDVPDSMLLETYDAERLKVIFAELNSCKQDEQQRSWMLHEDEAIIMEYITEMIQILTNADNKISCLVMSQDDYECIVMLIQYYQMEVRWSIRQLLLKAFGVVCNLDLIALRVMLSSVLPVELARDMQANPKDAQRLRFSALLLTMVFSMGERMPFTHFDQLGTDFMLFLLNIMHSPPDTDVEERLPDLFLNVILAYNLQFSYNDTENHVIESLEELQVLSIFTEKLLLLLNRDEDPVRVFKHEPAPSHSVLKLFIDIFSKPTSAQLFYTNDVKALIDIIVRQLSDLSPEDKKRQQYLEMVRRVVRNTNYSEHMHRRDDLSRIFTRIFCEEGEVSIPDQQLVREISNEFPQYFKA